ncbi:hypothetical protein AKJ39_01205 [candidate division MSBL1 archaeon SCGC-AAA259J03]|uniref:Arginine--tRNA ligase n=2 Tax=candidate division MSBL1 TaxID=215777 RepID=A0A656YX83_9EURY|nr:hypothetical protein AKJ36_02950 [candidate division MSBL1 archaeon SCGC-AAA259I07]KXA98683.1 hypothetical protein AKJ39_01205 [candidate division MSBL1 archaeon SCGC-AAA259J03]
MRQAFKELDWPEEDLTKTLEEPPDPDFGDLASTICFQLAKKLKKPPRELADELSRQIEPGGIIEKVEPEAGYVNFFVNDEELASLTLRAIEEKESRYGCFDIDGEKVIIEHTSVNPTKPLHVGHGRNAILGDTMSRILKACGHEVEIQNYIDDLGLQVAQTLTAYRSYDGTSEKKFDHLLGELYVNFNDDLEKNPDLEKEAREVLSKIEKSEGELAQEAREMALKCVESNLETSDLLNIDYDLLVWESNISNSGMLGEALERLKETSYLEEGEGEHEGALVLRLKDFGIEDKVMVRSDGTAVYTARDLAYQLWKFGEVEADLKFDLHSVRPSGIETYTTVSEGEPDEGFGHADRVINVIGVEQRYPQKVVFTALKALGLDEEYNRSHHLAYEHVRLPSEKFRGRTGTWIGYSVDDVLDETISRAEKEVEKRNPEAGAEFLKKAAEKVGVGAFRFSLISSSPEKEVVFKWEEALDFERNSGPAVQYSHARASSILRKAEKTDGEHPLDVFKEPQEYRLIKKLAKFPETVQTAGEQHRPHLLAEYASELSLIFNKFYEVAPVLNAETEELKRARLRLVNCSRIVLKNVLGLLGIEAPERM